ncbi:MAG TPA: DUF4142 domain-containing protein [Bryobacteraceae bacterium]
MNKSIRIMAFASFLAAGVPLLHADSPDASFLKDAAQGGMDEVKTGELAESHATRADVKAFGNRMVQDHGKMGDQVHTLAASKGVQLPTDISTMQSVSFKMLSGKGGADFDKAYISGMLKDHKKDIASFEMEASSGKDADVRALATKALPTLREHLQLAQKIATDMGIK